MQAQLESWASENHELPELAWDSLQKSEGWPNARLLNRTHFKTKRQDYWELARTMPPQLGRLDLQSDRVLLTPLALSFVPPAWDLVQAFVNLVRLAVERFEDPDLESTISEGEFASALHVDQATASLLTELALIDSWVLQPAGGNPGDGNFQVRANDTSVFKVADVSTFQDYTDAQFNTWFPDPEPLEEAPRPPLPQADAAVVMVVHGRDMKARDDLFNLLRAMGLRPIEWDDAVRATGSATPYTGDAVDAAFRIAQAAVVLCTPDEEVRLRENLRNPAQSGEAEAAWQPRPNVFFEGGIAFTTHPNRTVVLELGNVRIASDLLGRNTVRIGPGPEWRQTLAERLRTAGCAVDTSSTDWLTVGDFAAPSL